MGEPTTRGMRIQVHAPVIIVAFSSLGMPIARRDCNTSSWISLKKDTLKSLSLLSHFFFPQFKIKFWNLCSENAFIRSVGNSIIWLASVLNVVAS